MSRAPRFRLLTVLFLFPFVSHAGNVLVTDIDDTIRRTQVSDIGFTIYHGLMGAPAFAGMATLYDAMVPRQDFVALSGAPRSVLGNQRAARKVDEFLKTYGFDPYLVVLKGSLFENTAAFKVSSLNRLAEKERTEDFILIGDDTEKDPEVFDAFRTKHGDRIAAMYIRVVVNRSIPKGIKLFNSALDVAEAEYLQGRLSFQDYVRVGQDLLAADDETFLPAYAWCRREYNVSDQLTNPGMRGVRHAVNARMFKICQKRWNNPNWRRYYDRSIEQRDIESF